MSYSSADAVGGERGNLHHRKVILKMKITSINVKPVKDAPETGLVARLSMTIDNAVAIRGMRLLKREDGTYGLGMPAERRRNNAEKYDEFFHPINRDCRKVMEDAAVAAYIAAMGEADQQDSYIYDLEAVELDAALNITDIRFHFTKKPDAVCKAFVSVTLDNEFVLNQIHLVERKNGSKLLGMPNFPTRGSDGDRINVFHPISEAARTKLTEAVLAEYDKAKEEHDKKMDEAEKAA